MALSTSTSTQLINLDENGGGLSHAFLDTVLLAVPPTFPFLSSDNQVRKDFLKNEGYRKMGLGVWLPKPHAQSKANLK